MVTTRTAVVTGGSRGIGRSIARMLADEGLSVALTSRRLGDGQRVCEELNPKGDHAAFEVEMTDRDAILGFADALRERFGGVDVLVNNAGLALDGFDAEVARKTIQTNYFGPLHLYEAVAPDLRTGARVVNVSSGLGDRSRLSKELRATLDDGVLTIAGLSTLMEKFIEDVAAGRHEVEGWPGSAYCVSKIGLNRLTELLAATLAEDARGILVNAACPGWVRTDMGGKSAPRSPDEGADTPVWLARLPEDGPTGGFFRDRRRVDW